MLPHLPFFEALAGLTEGSAAWGTISAGLLVMRLVDDSAAGAAAHGWRVHAARLAVEQMPEQAPARALLGEIVELIATDAAAPPELLPRLAAYGCLLDDDGQVGIAADVLATTGELARVHGDAPLVQEVSMRLGALYRALGRTEDAVTAYTDAARLAAASAERWAPARARLAEANVALARGELDRAEQLLEHTVAEASEPPMAGVRAAALHDRAQVARARGELERAVLLAYDALRAMDDAPARERVLADVAALFRELGARAAARDALLLLVARAHEPYAQWLATVELMELAVLDGAELVFEQHRRTLLHVELPAPLAARYHYWTGEGCRRFGRAGAARDALERACALGAQHQLAAVSAQAQAALAALDGGASPPTPAAIDTPPALRTVAAEIRTLLDGAPAGVAR